MQEIFHLLDLGKLEQEVADFRSSRETGGTMIMVVEFTFQERCSRAYKTCLSRQRTSKRKLHVQVESLTFFEAEVFVSGQQRNVEVFGWLSAVYLRRYTLSLIGKRCPSNWTKLLDSRLKGSISFFQTQCVRTLGCVYIATPCRARAAWTSV